MNDLSEYEGKITQAEVSGRFGIRGVVTEGVFYEIKIESTYVSGVAVILQEVETTDIFNPSDVTSNANNIEKAVQKALEEKKWAVEVNIPIHPRAKK